HFLGGVFLAQYLSKHKDKRVKGVYLVAPPFDNATIDTEDLVNGFSIKKIDLPYPFVRVYFATDDSIVSPQHADKYTKFVEDVYLLDNRGHFITKTFPELIKHIKQDYKKYRKSVRT
ncbi:MAG: alpha/beta hydrolase, partial [Candidatus Woesearchaeota archaeon]